MFSEITKSQQRMWKMTIAVIAQSGSRFWSRHILVSGSDEKLQNTNCTETLLQAAKMRHKHYTPGHFPANNNNSERFFKFMLLVSVSFYHSCPGFDGMRPIENASRQVLFENNSVIFFQRFDKSFVGHCFCQYVFDVKLFLCEYCLNTPTFVLDNSHIVSVLK